MGAQAFDLADRLQTPMFVMLDLDIGMQDWLTDRSRGTTRTASDRGKVMTAPTSEGRDFGRYLDVDGDGIPFRTYPGTHPTRAATSRAARPRTATPATRRRAPPTSTTCSACCANSRPPGNAPGAR